MRSGVFTTFLSKVVSVKFTKKELIPHFPQISTKPTLIIQINLHQTKIPSNQNMKNTYQKSTPNNIRKITRNREMTTLSEITIYRQKNPCKINPKILNKPPISGNKGPIIGDDWGYPTQFLMCIPEGYNLDPVFEMKWSNLSISEVRKILFCVKSDSNSVLPTLGITFSKLCSRNFTG